MDVSQDSSGSNHLQLLRTRRSRIPDKPNYSLNLWSIMKNCIGKELSKIPMPVRKKQKWTRCHSKKKNPIFHSQCKKKCLPIKVNFSEPLSMLQRLTEDLEYSEILDRAARCDSSLDQMCLVAAFSVSSYSTTVHRTAKPFNPLLGETYELDRLDEYGYRSICEQVRQSDTQKSVTQILYDLPVIHNTKHIYKYIKHNYTHVYTHTYTDQPEHYDHLPNIV